MKDLQASFSQFISDACCSVLDCTLGKEGFWGRVTLPGRRQGLYPFINTL